MLQKENTPGALPIGWELDKEVWAGIKAEHVAAVFVQHASLFDAADHAIGTASVDMNAVYALNFHNHGGFGISTSFQLLAELPDDLFFEPRNIRL